jgi:signal transduction histidine kinase
MNFHQTFGAFVATTVFCVSAAMGQASQGSPAEAKKLVAAAAEHIKKVGPDEAIKNFEADKAKWSVKDLTVWVMDFKGVMRYHENPKMVGKNLIEIKDPSGRLWVKEMVTVGEGKAPGSVTYEWAHPETKKLAGKTAFLQPIPGTEVFAGVSVTH